MTIELNTSWLTGVYKNGEINVPYETIAYNDFFTQGEQATNIIEEIHKIWISGNLTREQAFEKWAEIYL